jgi:hypothetical protein
MKRRRKLVVPNEWGRPRQGREPGEQQQELDVPLPVPGVQRPQGLDEQQLEPVEQQQARAVVPRHNLTGKRRCKHRRRYEKASYWDSYLTDSIILRLFLGS